MTLAQALTASISDSPRARTLFADFLGDPAQPAFEQADRITPGGPIAVPRGDQLVELGQEIRRIWPAVREAAVSPMKHRVEVNYRYGE